MRKTLSILLSILSLSIMAQVPQGVGYQGVATDANGIELVNQSISIRASVLSGSATGTIEWEETHATTTDTFGLFTLTIGQGTNTTNGAQTNFADISWGTNTHFLKIEMDVTGGSTYSDMGTNQMMSVPYALFAESANINYDSISNFLSGDSTFITNVGGGLGGGCNYAFPDGLYGESFQIDLLNSNYTVPNGKNLYIISINSFGGSTTYFTVNGLRHSTNSFNSELPLIIKSGDEISYNWGANPSEFNVYGILIDDVIEPIQIDLLNSNYTVPNGKNLYIISINSFGGSTTYFTVNGLRHSTNSFNSHLPLIIKSGDEISYNWGANPSEFNVYGYLADENYFVGCGGGGSSSTSSLDSTAIANMIAAAGGGCTSFGNSTNVINLNWNPLTSSSYFEEAQEDGFFGGQMNCGSSYAGSFLVWDDTTSSPVYSYAITNGVATFLIPIKKGQYWNVSGICIDVNFFIPLECGGGGSSTNNSSFGPTFIDPIEIHGNGGNDKNVCENSSQTSFMTGIQFNADSALNQAVSNVILNIEFLVTTAGLSYNCSTSSMEMSSWNGSVTTPIMDYHYQSTQGTQSSRTVISKQVLIPTNNGIIDINITGSGCCQPSQGQINIVGYY